MMKRNIAFTVDVEDGISIAMRDAFSIESEQSQRVLHLTNQILDLLDHYQVKGTFFVLGQVAEKFPELIRQIANAGHELGVHGYNHLQFFRMNRSTAFEELSTAKKIIEDISGQEVSGHRAPAFSITPDTKWGLDVIAEAGFLYDSSIMPIAGIRYGWPGFKQDIQTLKTPSGHSLVEVPMSTVNILGRNIPAGGGGYLRLFPFRFTKWAVETIASEYSPIVYLHPYELDTERYPDYYFEALKTVDLLKQVKMRSMWINRSSVEPKLRKLLKNYEFKTMIDLVHNHTSDVPADNQHLPDS